MAAIDSERQRRRVVMIDDLETLRVVADRTRLDILRLLRDEPRTVKQVAAVLDVPPTKLYYHVRLLEEHGLIHVTDTRVVSGIIEKTYQASGYRLTVARELLPGGGSGSGSPLDVLLSVVTEQAADEIRRGVEAGLIDVTTEALDEGGLLLGRVWLRMTPERAAAFSARVTALFKEFTTDGDDPGARPYEVLIGIYPTLSEPDELPGLARVAPVGTDSKEQV